MHEDIFTVVLNWPRQNPEPLINSLEAALDSSVTVVNSAEPRKGWFNVPDAYFTIQLGAAYSLFRESKKSFLFIAMADVSCENWGAVVRQAMETHAKYQWDLYAPFVNFVTGQGVIEWVEDDVARVPYNDFVCSFYTQESLEPWYRAYSNVLLNRLGWGIDLFMAAHTDKVYRGYRQEVVHPKSTAYNTNAAGDQLHRFMAEHPQRLRERMMWILRNGSANGDELRDRGRFLDRPKVIDTDSPPLGDGDQGDWGPLKRNGQGAVLDTIELRRVASRNRDACGACSLAGRVGDEAVECRAVGERLDYVLDRCRLRKWPGKRPELPGVWVLSYPRTGSYYLCSLLNRVGFVPQLRERHNLNLGSLPASMPKNNKIHPRQFMSCALSLRDVISSWPNARFILLRRRDLVACAVSLYLAKQTGIWEVRSNQVAEKLQEREKIALDRRELMRCYERAVRDDMFWRGELEAQDVAFHEVFYEDLVENTENTLTGIYGSLGIVSHARLGSDVPNQKQAGLRPETAPYTKVLREMLGNQERVDESAYINLNSRSQLNPKRLILGVLSCMNPKYQERRSKCERTWLPELEAAGVEVVFLVGVGDTIDRPRLVDPDEHGRIGRELQIPCPDTYEALPQKTAAFCRWACEARAFDYLFKCDDDTYLVPKRLLGMDLIGVDYLGAPLFFKIPYANGGAGYFLSQQAAEIVAAEMCEQQGAEDLLVGQHLRRHGIKLIPDKRFVGVGSEDRRPKPANELVTTHRLNLPWSEHESTWAGYWDLWRLHLGLPPAVRLQETVCRIDPPL